MKKLFKNIGIVTLGCIVASITMMLFEFVNSRLFPFPEGFNTHDIDALQAFTQSLPRYAFLLVIVGSLLCGVVITKLSKEKKYIYCHG